MPREHQTGPLDQLLQLAQVARLLEGDPQQQRRIEQDDSQARMSMAIQLMGLHQRSQDDRAQRALQERTLEEEVKNRAAVERGNVTDALIHRQDIPLKLLGEALRKGGNSELANSLDEAYNQEVQKKAGALLPAIVAAKAKGGNTYTTVLSTAQSDPDVWNALKPHVEKLDADEALMREAKFPLDYPGAFTVTPTGVPRATPTATPFSTPTPVGAGGLQWQGSVPAQLWQSLISNPRKGWR